MCFYRIDRQIGRGTLVPSPPIIIRQRSAKIDKKKKNQQDLFSIASLPFCKDRIYKSSFAPSIYVVVCSFLTV